MVGQEPQRVLCHHAAVRHDDDAADPEPLPQPCDHRDERGPVRRLPRQDVPGDRPAVAIDGDAQHDLRLVGPPIARVAPLPQRRLRRPPDEGARRVDEEKVELLAEEIAVLEEQRPLRPERALPKGDEQERWRGLAEQVYLIVGHYSNDAQRP